jgi:hypothetical protein
MSIRHVAADFAADARQRRHTVGATALPSAHRGSAMSAAADLGAISIEP